MEEQDQRAKGKRKDQELNTFPVELPLKIESEAISFSKNKSINKNKIINQAFKFHSQGNFLEAVKYYQYCLEQGCNEATFLSNYGILLKDIEKFKEAEKLLRKSIELHPNFVPAYANLGSLFFNLGRLKEAEVLLRKAIKLKPDYAMAFATLGNTLRKLNRFKEAESSLREAIELRPEYATAHLNLGILYKELGNLTSAEKYLRKAIKLKPDYVMAYAALGNTLRDLGELKEAELLQIKAIKLQPNFSKAYSNLGGILKDQGKITEAKQYWLKAIKIDPKLEKTNFLLAEQLYFEKKYKSAINYLKGKSFHRCRSLYLSCLLCLDREEDFHKSYQSLVKEGICNAHVGGIIEHANVIYKNKYSSPFCNDAIKYILWDKISEESFSREYLNQTIEYLKNSQISTKNQGLLQHGVQTSGNLFLLNLPFINALKNQLELKIEIYKNKFKDCKQGFITNWPENYELRSWIIGMKSGGFLKQHNHEYGWITGSYYLKVPTDYRDELAGNIVFSNQGTDYPTRGKSFNSITKKVEFRDICLFPSSLFHKTIPFESKQERICFVFDLIQKD
ncbi:tetratricopeptide repeat protein [Prochlorococcus sp. MIT 0916]|uniref:tetratricopeptide repeat protein n=1 Tax=Prochlorococcus sp. MIT 0916 TaxID=3082521 RepID=UPI0039B5C6B4